MVSFVHFLLCYMSMESYQLELYPTEGPIHIALYKNVTNAAELRKRLLAQDQALSFAFIDAKVVINAFQILIAANRAVHDRKHGHLVTHNVNSEIVYNLSPTTNITESLRRFGISDSTKEIVIVKVGGDANEAKTTIANLVSGESAPLSQIDTFTDFKVIRKYYKLDSGTTDPKDVLDLVIGSMAIKPVS